MKLRGEALDTPVWRAWLGADEPALRAAALSILTFREIGRAHV